MLALYWTNKIMYSDYSLKAYKLKMCIAIVTSEQFIPSLLFAIKEKVFFQDFLKFI